MAPKSVSRKKRTGSRQITGSSRNIPATPLNPKYRVVVWLEQGISALDKSTSYTYAQLIKLAEAQLVARNIQTTIPTTGPAVFNYIEVAMAEAWSSPYANPQVAAATPTTYTNVPRIDLTVGPTSAIMPKSSIADVNVGIGERAYAKVRGNSSTWGEKTSTVTAVVVDWQTENQTSASIFLPLTLKFHVNLW